MILKQDTRCGLEGIDEEAFARLLEEHTGGIQRDWSIGGFEEVEDSVRRSIGLLHESPFLLHGDAIRGFVYEVERG